MSYLVKLVRDDIPALLGGAGTVTYGPITHDEHVKRLRRKLIGEATEYLTDPSVGELADVVAAARDLASVDLGVEWIDVLDAEADKRSARGGFTQGVGMFATHPSDTDAS